MLTVAVGAGEDNCEKMDSHFSTLGVSNKYLLTEKALFDFDDRGLRFEDIIEDPKKLRMKTMGKNALKVKTTYLA